MSGELDSKIHQVLKAGTVIPAHPLALNASRQLDERRQRALTRYYVAAGAGGLAVGVHTTQFAIRDPRVGLFEPVLKLAAEEMDRADRTRSEPLVRIGGICGETAQGLREARLLKDLKYSAGLVESRSRETLGRCRASRTLPRSCCHSSRHRLLLAAGRGRPRSVVPILAGVRRNRERRSDQDCTVQPLPDA